MAKRGDLVRVLRKGSAPDVTEGWAYRLEEDANGLFFIDDVGEVNRSISASPTEEDHGHLDFMGSYEVVA